MSGRPSGVHLAREVGARILAGLLAVIIAAALWLVAASALWSRGTGTRFTPVAWLQATQWWLANWWVDLWLVLAAAVPTIVLALLLFALFQLRRWNYRGRRRLTRSRDGMVRPSERGVTDNHGHSQWRSLGDAKKLFPGPDLVHGGIAVGEAYRVDHDQSVAGIPSIRPTRTAGAWAARCGSLSIPAPAAAGTA